MSDAPLDRRALGRTLTELANASAAQLARRPLRGASTTPARRIGITGAPGAGKSSLLGHLAVLRSARGRLGVLAVDPSSPRSGGAILGDRIRMDELPGAADLFIRSLGSRKTTDGLADNLPDMLDAMDDFAFAEVLLETVGVGQAEHAARAQVDTLALVLLPDSGDVVQAMKAGIMEMADIFVISKSDLPGSHRMATDIKRIAAITRREPSAWIPPVLLVSITQPQSIEGLSRAIDDHQAWLARGNHAANLRGQRAQYRLQRILERRIAQLLDTRDPHFFEAPLHEQLEATLALLRQYEAVS